MNRNVNKRFERSIGQLSSSNQWNCGSLNNNNNLKSSENSRIDSTFKNIYQTKIINDSFGQLTTNFLDKKKNKKINPKLRNPRNLCQSLPALSFPGSNMSNNLNTVGSDLMANYSMEPLANAEELIILNPMNRPYDDNYHKIRFLFSLSTFFAITIILFELGAIAVGITYTNMCELVDVYLIVSGCFHSIIIVLEWAKAWIWMQSSNPVVPDSNSDHMQVFVSCVLILIYIISIIWYTIGFAWIPNVFVPPLTDDNPKAKEIIIVHHNKTYVQTIPICNEGFYIYAICYQVVVAVFILFRIVMCCMSDFFKSLCTKFVMHTTPTSYETHLTNHLHDLLPPIRGPLYRWGFQGEGQVSGLSALYNSDKLCMITPMPLYPSDQKAVEEIPVPQF